ncbi:recombinase family protein, partial [Mycobacterium sp.]|uniref:recombinase family protein n=1 Tax=Mycobacterium sp. TaxID=1785 RepID=UPI002B6DB467
MTAKTAAIYTRISADQSGEALGVTRQEEACRKLAAARGYEVVQVYPDNDVSAFNGKVRPHFERLLGDMKIGAFDVLLCWHPDRLYRSLRDMTRVLDAAKLGGNIAIDTVNGGTIDPGTATGAMVATILGSVAIQESAHKGERQR